MMETMNAPSSHQHSWIANQILENLVIGSHSLRQECQNAVRKSFVYLRKHLTFESLRDKLVEKNLLSDRERDDYVCMIPIEYAMIGKVIKLMIKKGRCMEFIDIIDNLPDHRHVMNKINAARQLGNNPGHQNNNYTLKNGVPLTHETSGCALWIQQNFTYLQEELPPFDFMLTMLSESLDSIDNYDMYGISGAMRKTAKLLKILLRKGPEPCNDLIGKIKSVLKRKDMIKKMKERSIYLKIRGIPRLDIELQSLNVSCLQEHEQLLKNELDPLYLCDLLFEERAIELFEHDKVTEERRCNKQIPLLLEIVTENRNKCFHFFLHILLNRDYDHIIKKIVGPVEETFQNDSRRNERRILHNITKIPGDVENKSVELQLSVESSPREDERLIEQFRASASGMMENAISHGEMYVDDIKPGSVILQLRPVTEQAATKLLNAKENNRLLEMILGMLEHTDIEKQVDISKPLNIKVQVWYANSTKPKQDDHQSIKSQIKEHIKTCRAMLISKLEPLKLASFLLSSAYFSQSEIDRINAAPSRPGRVRNLLSVIEHGDSEVAKDFVSALTDAGFGDLAKLLDPIDFHHKAESIRTIISSNYKSFLEEMQLSIATEILSECIGEISDVKTAILPKNGSRRKRMNTFLQFILQEDYNVIVFEEMLKNSGLEYLFDLSKCEHIKETTTAKDVEVNVVEGQTDGTGADEVLFESVITISYTGLKKLRKVENAEPVQRQSLADKSPEQYEDIRRAMEALEDENQSLKVQLSQKEQKIKVMEKNLAVLETIILNKEAIISEKQRELDSTKTELKKAFSDKKALQAAKDISTKTMAYKMVKLERKNFYAEEKSKAMAYEMEELKRKLLHAEEKYAYEMEELKREMLHAEVTKPQTSTFPRTTNIMQPRKKRHPYPSQDEESSLIFQPFKDPLMKPSSQRDHDSMMEGKRKGEERTLNFDLAKALAAQEDILRDLDSMYAGKEKSTMRHASATEVKEFDKRRMPSCKPFVRRHLFPYPTGDFISKREEKGKGTLEQSISKTKKEDDDEEDPRLKGWSASEPSCINTDIQS
uniref:Uncharacterized protein LOC111110586 isoform X2 n=1 Tax=Crassostrea virginica TaxID=6565 RepID=A0A8B8BHW8_CRAVI|nr:uncharacterized protein LOC111110586 isoform X2 [Crassostrea virginica]